MKKKVKNKYKYMDRNSNKICKMIKLVNVSQNVIENLNLQTY